MAQPNVPMIVGCASNSAMQIYVAAAANQAKVPGIIYTAKCNEPTDATRYALEMGAEVNEVRPGYMGVLRKRARDRAKQLGPVVRWDVNGAIADAAVQVVNLPSNAKTVVIPTGSGLTAAGVLVGLVKIGLTIPVLAVAVSSLADRDNILNLARKHLSVFGRLDEPNFPTFTLIREDMKYSEPLVRRLPDDTPLDPFYAAKALDYVSEGDVLWVPGLRPIRSMPLICRRAFADWKGFK